MCPLDRNRAGDLSVYDFAITAERDSQLHHKGIYLAVVYTSLLVGRTRGVSLHEWSSGFRGGVVGSLCEWGPPAHFPGVPSRQAILPSTPPNFQLSSFPSTSTRTLNHNHRQPLPIPHTRYQVANMPSVKNPNKPSKNRLAARAAKARKTARASSAAGQSKVSIQDKQRGAKPGLLPTSGPRAAVSKKKAKKLEQRARLNLRRRVELGLAEMEEVEMKGWCFFFSEQRAWLGIDELTGWFRCGAGGWEGGEAGGDGY
jgi:hypothetical protein